MRSVDFFNHAKVQAEHLPQIYTVTNLESSSSHAVVGRVEYLPVEWHEAFSILTQRRSPLSDLCERATTTDSDTGIESLYIKRLKR